MQSTLIEQSIWESAQAVHLLERLGVEAGMELQQGPLPPLAQLSEQPSHWMLAAAAGLGMEASAKDLRGQYLEQTLCHSVPAVVPAAKGFLAVLAATAAHATLLRPDGNRVRVAMKSLRNFLCREAEEPHRAGVDRLLSECGFSGKAGSRRRARAAAALLRQRTRNAQIGVAYALHTRPGAPFSAAMKASGLRRGIIILSVSHLMEYVLLMGAWGVLGRGVLSGRMDTGVLTAWALMLATMFPFRLLSALQQGSLSIGLGGLLRERLLDGALKLGPDEVRHEGAGSFFGRAVEVEQVESAAINGGIMAILSGLEVLLALAVLASVGAWLQGVVLLSMIAFALVRARTYFRHRHGWTAARLDLTAALFEAMTGHRTRLAQLPPGEWHVQEDRSMEHYNGLARSLDHHQVWLGIVPRLYLVAALLAFAPAVLSATPDPTRLAGSLGAIIIALHASRRMAGGLAQISGAAISWQRIRDLFEASARSDDAISPAILDKDPELVVSGRGLSYAYGPGQAVVHNANLEIRRGDRLLLEGSSGGGKSTFLSLLTGWRKPTEGSVLAGGLDLATLGGAQWRRAIAAAPQYHDNHVIGNTFAFNLLMGRNWPPSEADLAEAEKVCQELGLGQLLSHMPAGLFQMVGETGWQLSQGERSRMFLARALLQRPELVVLDESFAALDPETLKTALECALARSKTLMVVAHP